MDCMIPPRIPKTSETTSHKALTMIEMIAHILAFFAACCAPAISPALAFLLTWVAKITEINPCGKQQNKNETTAATIEITKLFGTVAGAAPAGGGGVQFCDIFNLLHLFSCELTHKNDEACLKNDGPQLGSLTC